jgi:hypothetical protein
MALIRGHHDFDDHFAQIPNDWLRDGRVSLEARGLLAQIMSHRPGWNLSVKSIAGQNKIGADKVRRILNELLEYGYLHRSEGQSHNDKGHLAGFDYTTSNPSGLTQEPYKGKPVKVEPSKANGLPKNTISKEYDLSRTTLVKNGAFDEFWGVYPKKADKPRAKSEFDKALKRVSFEVLLAGAHSYRDDPNRSDQYTKNPSTWLHNDSWENSSEPAPKADEPKMTNAQRNLAAYNVITKGALDGEAGSSRVIGSD